ncbi:MAG: type II secretion system protein M [Nevskia sp.]|nr:type II secretion system protein M [Nevskia sp.]
MNFLNPYRERLAAQLAPLRARFDALQPREQALAAAMAVVVALALVYLALWEPLALLRAHRARDLEAARALAGQLELLGAQAGAGRLPAAPPPGVAGASLLSTVDQSTKDGSLAKAPTRLQPDGDNQVRIWFEDVPFDSLLRWMNALQTRYGVRIDNASIERRQAAGTVNARLALVHEK